MVAEAVGTYPDSFVLPPKNGFVGSQLNTLTELEASYRQDSPQNPFFWVPVLNSNVHVGAGGMTFSPHQ